MTFIPDSPKPLNQRPPYFEDTTDDDAPGRTTSKSPASLQPEIADVVAAINVTNVTFLPGTYPPLNGAPARRGYRMTFTVGPMRGQIEIAALPCRNSRNEAQALAQALFSTRDWLKGEVQRARYQPVYIPLVPYLIDTGDGKTVTETLFDQGGIATLLLPPPKGA